MIYLLPITAAAFIGMSVLLLKRIKFRTDSLENAVRQRENTEARLVHLNSVLRAARNVNQLITHERNTQTLLQQTCGYLTEREGYFYVWLMFLDEEGRFKDAFESGIGKPFEEMKERMREGNYTDCIRKSLSSEDIIIKKDHMNTCTDCPLKHSHKQRGSMSVRITYQDRVFGVLTVSVQNRFLEEEDEHELLQELAGDLGFALHDIEVSQNTEEKKNERELRFRSMLLNQIQDKITATDLEGRITYINDAECIALGRTREQIVGDYVFSYGEDPSRGATQREIIENTIRDGEWRGEVVNYDTKGNAIILDSRTRVVYDDAGEPIALVGISTDITEQVHMREQLSHAIKEKDILLRELYHRTKNNMQVIASIVSLKRSHISDKEFESILKEIETKIYAMSLVHQKLYQTKDLSNINITDYIKELSKILLNSFLKPTDEISIRYDMEEVNTLIDVAVPLGLVINEILMNCIKHAFPEKRKGEITVTLRQKNAETLVFTVADNGVGLPEEIDIAHSKTVGFQIIYNVIRTQLNGTVSVENDDGTRWNIVIGETGYRERV